MAFRRACKDHVRLAASAGRVLTASLDRGDANVTVWEWQVGTLTRLRSFPHDLIDDLAAAKRDNGARLWSVAISPDGKLGLVAATNGKLAIFDLDTGLLRTTLTGAAHQPAVAWSHDGRWTFSGDRAGRLLGWELSRLPDVAPALDREVHPVKKVNDQKGAVDVAVSTVAETVATFGTDRMLVVTRRGARRTIGKHGSGQSFPKTLALSPDARFALTVDKVELNLWDLQTLRLAGRAESHKVERITFCLLYTSPSPRD